MTEFSPRGELKRNTVHAITEASRLGPVVENMSEVASAAMNLGADQEKEAAVLCCFDCPPIGAQKLGQPVLLSNLVLEENSGRSHPAHT